MRFLSRQMQWLLWCFFLSIWIFLIFYPLSNGLTRAAGVAVSLIVFFGLLALCWRTRAVRYILFAILILCALVAVVPGSSHINVPSLRQRCAHAMQRYNHVHYVWGGESFVGIDCSGLIRRGYIDGCFVEGIRTFNPRLIRHAFYVWWHDCSAKQLGNEYLHLTRHLLTAPSSNEVDSTKIESGDLAVTTSGIHVLAYIGENTWTEADPGIGKVVQVKVPSDNPWLRAPVNVMRWTLMDSKSSSRRDAGE